MFFIYCYKSDKIMNFNGLPDPLLSAKAEITQEQRDKMIHFNTKQYWHCWFDVKTKKIYNEYCRKILDDATDYLLSAGMINSKLEQIKSFEPE